MIQVGTPQPNYEYAICHRGRIDRERDMYLSVCAETYFTLLKKIYNLS